MKILVLSAKALQATECIFSTLCYFLALICRSFARGLHTRTAVARLAYR